MRQSARSVSNRKIESATLVWVAAKRFPKGQEMKVFGIAAAAVVVAFEPLSVVADAPGVGRAAPCAGPGADPVACQHCMFYVTAYHTANVCNEDRPRPAQVPPSSVPTWQMPPMPVVQEPPPVQAPPAIAPSPPPRSRNPPQIPTVAPGAPRDASLVTPPKGLEASAQAVAAAKAAPATRINPATTHQMLQLVDFNQQVQNVVSAHGGNVDLVKVDNQELVRPRHWDYLDYDAYHRPMLYNPLTEAMTFRYFYNGADREAYVPAGGRVVLDVAAGGVFAFTAVGDSYVAAGSFSGGAWIPPDGWNGPPPPDYTAPPPAEVYQDVSAHVPAADQTVAVGQVQVVRHDGSQPAGSQDTFLLDASTLAWGQINDPGGSAQITVTKTQPLPGVGPTDNGSFLAALATQHEEPPQPAQPWWPMAMGYGGFAAAVCLIAWMMGRRKPERGSDRLSQSSSLPPSDGHENDTRTPNAAWRYVPRMRDIETIDSELRLVAALRQAARERGGPLPSIDVADALLDERVELKESGLQTRHLDLHNSRCE